MHVCRKRFLTFLFFLQPILLKSLKIYQHKVVFNLLKQKKVVCIVQINFYMQESCCMLTVFRQKDCEETFDLSQVPIIQYLKLILFFINVFHLCFW